MSSTKNNKNPDGYRNGSRPRPGPYPRYPARDVFPVQPVGVAEPALEARSIGLTGRRNDAVKEDSNVEPKVINVF